MSTVYLVAQGSYSDYAVVAIFSTKELAEAHVAKLKECSSYDNDEQVEEFVLDGEADMVVVKIYNAEAEIGTGEVTVTKTTGSLVRPGETFSLLEHRVDLRFQDWVDTMVSGYSLESQEAANADALSHRDRVLDACGGVSNLRLTDKGRTYHTQMKNPALKKVHK